MNEMYSINDMLYLLEVPSITILTHRTLENLRKDTQLSVQNIEDVVQDRQVKHGPYHGAEMLLVNPNLRRDAVVAKPGLAFLGRGSVLSSLWSCPMDWLHPRHTHDE
jgi:hypothetical protein